MPHSCSQGQSGGGRIHPHQRDADFIGKFIGDEIHLSEDYITSEEATEQHKIEEKKIANTATRLRRSMIFGKSISLTTKPSELGT